MSSIETTTELIAAPKTSDGELTPTTTPTKSQPEQLLLGAILDVSPCATSELFDNSEVEQHEQLVDTASPIVTPEKSETAESGKRRQLSLLPHLRTKSTDRNLEAGCWNCVSDGTAKWTGPQCQGQAARHADAFGHHTWVVVTMLVEYNKP